MKNEQKYNLLLELARNNLIVFCKLVDDTYKPAKFHYHLARKLEKACRCKTPNIKKICRLVIGMPPQHGKSRLCSQFLPAWLLGKFPSIKIALASYAVGRAIDNSMLCKDIINSPKYKEIFPNTSIRVGMDTKEIWYTTDGGYVKSVGVTGSLTGTPLDLIIIDDPIKDAEEASSKNLLEKIWEWYVTVAKTRAGGNFGIIILMTRWNVHDLVGRVTDVNLRKSLEEVGIDYAWEVYNYRAECEDEATDILGRKIGEFLWPEKFDKSHYLEAKITSPHWWASMYQQNPRILGGNLIKTDKINITDVIPTGLKLVRYWDLAVTDKTKSDFTAGCLGGIAQNGDFYVLHMAHIKKSWGEAKQFIVDLAKEEKIPIVVEGNGTLRVACDELKNSLAGFCQVHTKITQGDKIVNSTGWQSLVETGKFYIKRGAWNSELISEIADFPKGAHDDQVDAVSGAYNFLKSGTQSSVVIARYG